jgi:hypothetical protein
LVLKEEGWFDDAIVAHQEAIEIYRELSDRDREARAWQDLGLAFMS